MSSSLLKWGLRTGWLSGGVFFLTALVVGNRSPWHDWQRHPVSFLGALNRPEAMLWNGAGCLLTGLLLLGFSLALDTVLRRMAGGRAGRFGTGMLMISAVAFGAMGVFPLDLEALESPASQWHVSTLAISQLALLAGGVLVTREWYRQGEWSRWAMLGSGVWAGLLLCQVYPPSLFLAFFRNAPGLAHDLTFLLYFSWFALAAVVAERCRVRQISLNR